MNNRRERGSNLVEMALGLLILVILLIGVVDIGRAFHSYIVITNASREGARRASRFPDQDDVVRQATIQEAANSDLDLSGPEANVVIDRPTPTFGHPITVTVNYTYTTFIGGLVGLARFPMRSSTTMVIYGYTE